MAIEPSGQFQHMYEAEPASPRSYSPDRPNTFYKNDPRSEQNLMSRALDARREETKPENLVETPGWEGMTMKQSPREYNANRILGQSEETNFSPMTVGQAQDAADAGFPITGDASVSNYDATKNLEGSLTDQLDAVNNSRDDAMSSAQDGGNIFDDIMENGVTPETQEALNAAGRANAEANARHRESKGDAESFVQKYRGKYTGR